ncbi:hypothetical protein BCR44DRAFT_84479 [Catenaria anguillulae PL171]|uniref:Uncharacterized protein n=1 Tax=Catenaria anguillulae PL171 TaxID=765915 RepID=A0A1Y2HAY7_9FUNG|nr:hypothetical protein BCR44DRAFT_84479 [Catenaria anguillulae PL171]
MSRLHPQPLPNPFHSCRRARSRPAAATPSWWILAAALVALALAVLVSAGQDYYALLGVSKSADKRQISKAYRKLALKYHPDKNPGDAKAKDMFVKLANAYEILNDEEKRRIYDQYGEEGIKQGAQGGGPGGPFHDPFDIFQQFAGGAGGFHFNFGHGGGRHHHQPEKRGHDLVIPLQVTLADLYNGVDIEVDVNKQILCPTCRGSGARSDDDVHTCSGCQGRGVKTFRQMLAPGMFTTMQQVCDECGGKGKVVKHKCPVCSGSKVQRGSSQLTVSVERGMQPGSRIVFEREADASPDYSPGDAVFVLEEVPHPVFVREGVNNLRTKVQIGLVEALGGFERAITHLDGHKVTLKRDKGTVTQPGFVQVVEGEGMPVHTTPSIMGKLFVEYEVVLPDKVTEEQVNGLAKLFGARS